MLDSDAIYSVRQVTTRLQQVIENALPFVWVRGEVTNISRPSSGHVYFSLRDADALLHCVWFRGHHRLEERFDPLTGEVYEDGARPNRAQTLSNGEQVVCAGNVSVYGPRGHYQLLVEFVHESGHGALLRRLNELKQTLSEKGWFATERKRPLPLEPRHIALITAPNGAAVHDFMRVAVGRGLGAEIELWPVPVQGNDASERICNALQHINLQAWADVIVLIRGGGSLEDLWAFNNEQLAAAIIASHIPVLTGIGHEIDTSIADLVADCRAATPSHAAQILWREKHWYIQQIDTLEIRLKQQLNVVFSRAESQLETIEKVLGWLAPTRRLERMEHSVTELERRLRIAMEQHLYAAENRLQQSVVNFNKAFHPDMLTQCCERIAFLENKRMQIMKHRMALWEQDCTTLSVQLEALDPHAPLRRGYALLQTNTKNTQPITAIEDIQCGSSIRIRLQGGAITATVTDIQSTINNVMDTSSNKGSNS